MNKQLRKDIHRRHYRNTITGPRTPGNDTPLEIYEMAKKSVEPKRMHVIVPYFESIPKERLTPRSEEEMAGIPMQQSKHCGNKYNTIQILTEYGMAGTSLTIRDLKRDKRWSIGSDNTRNRRPINRDSIRDFFI